MVLCGVLLLWPIGLFVGPWGLVSGDGWPVELCCSRENLWVAESPYCFLA